MGQGFRRGADGSSVSLVCRFVFREPPKLWLMQTSQLMVCREIIAVCSEIHTKHINTVCGQNVELLNLKLVVHIVTTGL